ncbi:MAG: hypothetical protein AAFX39_17155, partial [Pseudomonadota bacterium]
GFSLAIFVLVGAATFMLLSMDLREIAGDLGSNRVADSRTDGQSVVTERPTTGDQTRPYLPAARPIAPGRDLPQDRAWPAASEAAPMQFRRLGPIIMAAGTITPGTAASFDRFLAEQEGAEEPLREVVLHSPGGLVDEAIALAVRIRAEELDTHVVEQGYCASSCPLVFAAGKDRIAHADAWIGVHQAFLPPDTFGSMHDGIQAAQEVAAAAQELLDGFGVDALVWTFAMRTPKDQLYFFTTDQLVDLRLATRIDSGAQARFVSVPLPREKPVRN